MAKRSAGILLHREAGDGPEVLLVHPGGPYWQGRDLGAWTIPKGEHDESEEALACALREFAEETGTVLVPDAPAELGEVRLKSGKIVTAWAVRGDLDAAAARSSSFTLEWPPRSGRHVEIPEVDRAEWFSLPTARVKLNPAQVTFLDRLVELLEA